MNESFGEWVKLLRVSKGWNQKKLAEATRFVPSVITKVELDQQEPTADFCIALAAAMGLSVEYVLAKAGKPGYEQYLNSEGGTAAHGESAAVRQIRALIDLLDDEDQKRAIKLLETFVETHRAPSRARPARKTSG